MAYDDDSGVPPVVVLRQLEGLWRQEFQSLERLNQHYEGTQPLSYMAPELVMELSDRLRQVVVGWPQLVVDSVEERLDVEGFRLGGQADADEDLWRIWQANDLDEQSQQGHLDALVMRRAFAVVGGPSEEGSRIPTITVESPLQMVARRDPRTRKVRDAAKWWIDEDDDDRTRHAALYLPNETSYWVFDKGGMWVPDPESETDEHGLGVVPVEPIVNRPRLVRPATQTGDGVSDLSPIIPLSDAACKIATDMMVSAEFHAMPRRYALGFRSEDFVDADGNPVGAFSRVAGRIWATEASKNDGVEVGQFPEANLSNFHETLNTLAKVTASIAGLPPHYLGMSTDNPPSADAIRSNEARLVKRAERKQRSFGGSWERIMRLALRVRDGKVPDEALSMETLWRDASTPTIAQAADAAQKLYDSHIVPLRQTRERLNFSQATIELMEAEDAKQAEQAAAAFGLKPGVMPGDQPAPADAGPQVPAPRAPSEPAATTLPA